MTEKDSEWTLYADKIKGLIDTLSEQERNEIQENITIAHYRKNEVIYSEGETPRNLLCLVEGKVKIYKDGVGGRAQIMRVLGTSEYFGYRAFIADEPFITTAAAFEPCTVLKIPMFLIVGYIQQNPRLGWFFVRQLSLDLGTSDERTVNLTQKHIRGRLAESLLFLRDNYGLEADGSTLSIHPSREDLANLSNMTTSNAIRTLSSFASENLVAIEGRKIRLVNIAEIERISRLG